LSIIRRCGADDYAAIYEIINAAALAYRGIIPSDRWREPYMPHQELQHEIHGGVEFWGCQFDDELLGVMGLQYVQDVALIRHAYVLPAAQGLGIGGSLIRHLISMTQRRLLVGTWADASWAITFYQRHGFELLPDETARALLRKYWSIPERQLETSVVLSRGLEQR